MRTLSLLLTLALIVIVVAFAALNAGTVQIHYFLGTTVLPLAVVLLLALIVGCLLGTLILSIWVFRIRRQNKKLKALVNKQSYGR